MFRMARILVLRCVHPGLFPIMHVYRKLRNPRRVLRSHAPVPVWEANGRAISVYEHGHDRLGEMVNTG
jgi:hypothetical protein